MRREPRFPAPHAGADVEHTAELRAEIFDETDHTRDELRVLCIVGDARGRVEIETLVILLVEAQSLFVFECSALAAAGTSFGHRPRRTRSVAVRTSSVTDESAQIKVS